MRTLIIVFAFLLSSCYLSDELAPDQRDWTYATPESLGINEGRLLEIHRDILDSSYQEIKSLVIIKNDQLIFENYYDTLFRQKLRRIGLSTAIVTMSLFGEVLHDGLITSLDTPIHHFLPQQKALFDLEPLKRQITFRHLLEHKNGLEWNESIRAYRHPDNDLNRMKQEADWPAYVLKKTYVADPGLRHVINYGSCLLLIQAMEHVLEEPFETYAKRKFFDPMGIKDYRWETDPLGNIDGATGLYLKELDWAKLAHVAINEGHWKSQSIINREWMNEMLDIRFRKFDYNMGYGWNFIGDTLASRFNIPPQDIMFSPFENGQFIFSLPRENVFIVMYAENYYYGFYNSPSFALFLNLYYSLRS